MPALTAVVIIVAVIALLALGCALPSTPPECHPAPGVPYSPDAAHLAWQDRIDCDTRWCADKRSAYWALADAGLITADLRVPR